MFSAHSTRVARYSTTTHNKIHDRPCLSRDT